MRQVPKIWAVCAVIAATTFASTACGSTDATGTIAAPASALSSAAPSPSGVVTQTSADTVAPTVVAPEMTTAAPLTPTAAGAVTVPPVPNRDDINVDARDFEQAGGQYFFTSPSGNAFCGINSANAPGTVVGCQVRYSVPGNTGRTCANTANNTYGVEIRVDGTVQQICTNQGIFVGDANGNGVRVLQYGQIIGVTGTICRSTETGITCYDGSEGGFMISRDVNLTF